VNRRPAPTGRTEPRSTGQTFAGDPNAFRETTRVLTEAAISGKVDQRLGHR